VAESTTDRIMLARKRRQSEAHPVTQLRNAGVFFTDDRMAGDPGRVHSTTDFTAMSQKRVSSSPRDISFARCGSQGCCLIVATVVLSTTDVPLAPHRILLEFACPIQSRFPSPLLQELLPRQRHQIATNSDGADTCRLPSGRDLKLRDDAFLFRAPLGEAPRMPQGVSLRNRSIAGLLDSEPQGIGPWHA
jgi:hypothetical protein